MTRNKYWVYIWEMTKRYYRTSPMKHLTITPLIHQIIIGKMLGDLTAERPSVNHNTRLQFKQSAKQYFYIWHLWEIMKPYCGSKPIFLQYLDTRPNLLKKYSSWKFSTLSLPCFNFIEIFSMIIKELNM